VNIVEDQAVRFKIESSKVSLITDYLERSQVLEDNGKEADVLVYWGIEEMQRLVKVCGDKVPSPIQRDYKWPGMYTPFKHQEITAAFLSLQDRAFALTRLAQARLPQLYGLPTI
jgi:hypothetical protein